MTNNERYTTCDNCSTRVLRDALNLDDEGNALCDACMADDIIIQADALGYQLLIANDYTTVAPQVRNHYTPEVHRAYKGPWEIMTTSYGVVSPEAVDRVIDGLKRAQEMVKLLNGAGL